MIIHPHWLFLRIHRQSQQLFISISLKEIRFLFWRQKWYYYWEHLLHLKLAVFFYDFFWSSCFVMMKYWFLELIDEYLRSNGYIAYIIYSYYFYRFGYVSDIAIIISFDIIEVLSFFQLICRLFLLKFHHFFLIFIFFDSFKVYIDKLIWNS